MVTIYKELSKAKLSALVVTSTLMGYWMAGGAVACYIILSLLRLLNLLMGGSRYERGSTLKCVFLHSCAT